MKGFELTPHNNINLKGTPHVSGYPHWERALKPAPAIECPIAGLAADGGLPLQKFRVPTSPH